MAKLVVMLVMLSMTKHFLKMYVFLFAFIYFILFYFLIGFFFIFRIFSCMIFSDIQILGFSPWPHHMPVYVAGGNSPANPVQPARVGESGKL